MFKTIVDISLIYVEIIWGDNQFNTYTIYIYIYIYIYAFKSKLLLFVKN